MTQLLLASFLIFFGVDLFFGLSIPAWVLGLLAVSAGVSIIIRRYRSGFERPQARDLGVNPRVSAPVPSHAETRGSELFTD